jgi:hypothetical protein
VRGTDNSLWELKGTNLNTAPTWTWIWLGGQLASNTGPAACSWSATHVAVFVQGSDGALWWRSTSDGNKWTAWASLGGKLISAPAATALSDGSQIGLFVAGTDHAIWYKQSTSGKWDTSWHNLGGQLLAGTSPAAYNWGTTQIGWLVTGTDSQLFSNFVTGGGSSGYEAVGGVLTSSPSATSRAPTLPNSIDVFARVSSGQTSLLEQIGYNTVKSGTWSDWSPITNA